MTHIRILFKAEYLGWQEMVLNSTDSVGYSVTDTDGVKCFVPYTSIVLVEFNDK